LFFRVSGARRWNGFLSACRTPPGQFSGIQGKLPRPVYLPGSGVIFREGAEFRFKRGAAAWTGFIPRGFRIKSHK